MKVRVASVGLSIDVTLSQLRREQKHTLSGLTINKIVEARIKRNEAQPLSLDAIGTIFTVCLSNLIRLIADTV